MKDNCDVDDNELDFEKLSTKDIIDRMLARNRDPPITRLIEALSTRPSDQITDGVEAERRGRSVVITGLKNRPKNDQLPNNQTIRREGYETNGDKTTNN
ncbi:hypothetical protein OESDEN_01411 [Oesophagostomum dentatum]|uniref:Uncharacterized protein n=1 Tax=Oesophagostomum dentatum TaxID=61180 RepID=A0A0B1TM46_OESDE|nr:hypothetical protein OESDEN_01411 [Oesophagostomum dentatum]